MSVANIYGACNNNPVVYVASVWIGSTESCAWSDVVAYLHINAALNWNWILLLSNWIIFTFYQCRRCIFNVDKVFETCRCVSSRKLHSIGHTGGRVWWHVLQSGCNWSPGNYWMCISLMFQVTDSLGWYSEEIFADAYVEIHSWLHQLCDKKQWTLSVLSMTVLSAILVFCAGKSSFTREGASTLKFPCSEWVNLAMKNTFVDSICNANKTSTTIIVRVCECLQE